MKKFTKCVAISMMASIIGMTSIASVGAAVCDSEPVIARPDGMYSVKAAAPNVQTTREYVLGDSSGDGCITISDATFIQKYLVGKLIDGYEYDMVAMDVNKDGKVDVYDATCVQRHVAKFKDAKTQEVGKTFTTPYKKDGITRIDPKGQEDVGAGGEAVSDVTVTAETEGIVEYEKVGSWAIDTNADWFRYVADNNVYSSDLDQAGQHYSKDGYIKSHIEYVDENGKPDAGKVTVFFDEKPAMHSDINLLVLSKVDGNTIFEERNADKLATAWQTGKYTYDLPKTKETKVTAKVSWEGVYNNYTVALYKDGKEVETKDVSGFECTFEGLTEGSYEARVSVLGNTAVKEFTVGTESVGNGDSHEFKLAQTERRSVIFCNNCGCWVGGNVADHLITESDWAKVKAEAATHEQTSEGSYYNYPRYHKQYFLKDFTNQTVVDPKYSLNKTGNWMVFTKPGEESVDCFTENPYLVGDIHEEEQLNYGGECSLILVPDKSDMTEFIKATIALAPWMGEQKFLGKINPDQGRYLFDENGVVLRDENGNPVRNARYETVLAGDRTVESILNMDYYKYHTVVQKCPGGYHDEWVDVIVDYEVFTAPETYTEKLTVK